MDVVFEPSPATILVVEDDPQLQRYLQETLRIEGYDAVIASTGEEGIAHALREPPHLLLLDLTLPGAIDGFDVVERLRANIKTAHIPVVILSGRSETAVKVRALDSQADDYLTKPFSDDELMARIRTQLRRLREHALAPLTGLPSGPRIERAISQRLRSDAPWAILYLDLNNFKAYNDVYGPLRGNEMIQLLGQLAMECVRELGDAGDFVGHIGGEDFVIITAPDRVEALCSRLIARWDVESRAYYTDTDLQRGALLATDRQGQRRVFPLIGLSVGVIRNGAPLASVDEVSRVAAEVKRKAKATPGSGYYVDSGVTAS